MFGPKLVGCPAGVWTRIVFSVAKGYSQEYMVDLSAKDGAEVSGSYEIQPFFWILPSDSRSGPLGSRLRFRRAMVNSIYIVKIKPDSDTVATVRVVRGRMIRNTLLVLSLLFAILLIPAYLSKKAFVSSAERAEGEVVANVVGGGDSIYPLVRFKDSSGKVHEFTSRVGSVPPAYDIGEAVPVLFDPKAPKNARLDTFFETWNEPVILFIFLCISSAWETLLFVWLFLLRNRMASRSEAKQYPQPV